jgi:invasion protein IalB
MWPLSKARLSALTRVFVLAAFLAAAEAPPANAQEPPRTVFGDWQLRCDPVPGGGEQCAAAQRVAAADRGDVWLDAFLFKPPEDDGAFILSILVPLQVILTKGIGIRIDDDADVSWFYFRSCSVDGCVAPIPLDDDLRSAMRNGGEALFIIFFEDDVGIGVPLSLAGFSAAIDALP